MTMQTAQQSIGQWVPCDSCSALVAQLPKNACELLTTDSPNNWGYVAFDLDVVIPIGYADIGLIPLAIRLGNRAFVGINELLVGYDCSSQTALFKYKMPTVFHEFVRFDRDGLIVRDEIGFVGVSYDGNERWNFCIDIIGSYEINKSTILGKTGEGKNFKFVIPAGWSGKLQTDRGQV